MTVSSTLSRISYNGDGISTVFSYPYNFQVAADLSLFTYNQSTGAVIPLVLNTDYTIPAATDPDFGYPNGINVTLLVALAVGLTVVIFRNPEALQGLSIPTAGPMPSKPIERELDLITMIAQRYIDLATRSVHLSDGAAPTFDPTLPAALALPANAGVTVIVNPTSNGFSIGPNAAQIAAAAAAAASTSIYSWMGTSGGAANVQTLTPPSALAGYGDGIRIGFLAGFTNSGPMTLNVSGLGAVPVKTQSGAALSSGEFVAGRVYTVTYLGGNFVLQEVSTPEDGSVVPAKIPDASIALVKLTAALQALLTPTGMVTPYGGSAAPTGYLLCDGTSYLRTDQAALFAVIGTTFGSVDGTHFNVPDCRNVFLRGANAATRAISGTTYPAVVAGATTKDMMQGHRHDVSSNSGAGALFGLQTNSSNITFDQHAAGDPTTDGVNGTPRTGSETAPVNLGINYIIKT